MKVVMVKSTRGGGTQVPVIHSDRRVRESYRRTFNREKRNDDKGPVTFGGKACGSLTAGANDKIICLRLAPCTRG